MKAACEGCVRRVIGSARGLQIVARMRCYDSIANGIKTSTPNEIDDHRHVKSISLTAPWQKAADVSTGAAKSVADKSPKVAKRPMMRVDSTDQSAQEQTQTER